MLDLAKNLDKKTNLQCENEKQENPYREDI